MKQAAPLDRGPRPSGYRLAVPGVVVSLASRKVVMRARCRRAEVAARPETFFYRARLQKPSICLEQQSKFANAQFGRRLRAVSYTHLTLPTICSV
eukprot:10032570-Alexandrium_andersonii.AAC.1